MWPFLKEFFNTKLKLGYILCFLAVGALFLSAQKSLAPSIISDHSIKVSRFTKDGAYVSQCSRLTPLKLSQKIAALGHAYVDYGTAFAKHAVGGNIIESIMSNKDRDSSGSFGIVMSGLGITHESHKFVLARQLSDWCAQANAMSPETFALSDMFDPSNSPLKLHKSNVAALSVNARQYISMERYVAATEPICSSQITADVGTDPELGIEQDIKNWYMDSHSETQAEAEIEGEAVASQSSGNGWTYTDADILGMVYPLHLSANDSVIDVGCGDGYFLSRLLHFYSRHRLAVVGVDIMDFYVYTARARFLSISVELQVDHEGPLVFGSKRPNTMFPAACLGSGLDLRWIADGTFDKYIALSPINHFDDKGGEKMVCEAFRVLKRGGIAWFGMVNRETGTFVVKYVKKEDWFQGVAKRCGFSRVVTTSECTEWRYASQPTPRYHAYLYKD